MAGLPKSGRTTLVKKNAKSMVWLYFGLMADEKGVPVLSEEHRAVCRTCTKAVMCKGGNSNDLFTHLRDAQPEHNEVIQGKMDMSKGKQPEVIRPTYAGVIEREGIMS